MVTRPRPRTLVLRGETVAFRAGAVLASVPPEWGSAPGSPAWSPSAAPHDPRTLCPLRVLGTPGRPLASPASGIQRSRGSEVRVVPGTGDTPGLGWGDQRWCSSRQADGIEVTAGHTARARGCPLAAGFCPDFPSHLPPLSLPPSLPPAQAPQSDGMVASEGPAYPEPRKAAFLAGWPQAEAGVRRERQGS